MGLFYWWGGYFNILFMLLELSIGTVGVTIVGLMGVMAGLDGLDILVGLDGFVLKYSYFYFYFYFILCWEFLIIAVMASSLFTVVIVYGGVIGMGLFIFYILGVGMGLLFILFGLGVKLVFLIVLMLTYSSILIGCYLSIVYSLLM